VLGFPTSNPLLPLNISSIESLRSERKLSRKILRGRSIIICPDFLSSRDSGQIYACEIVEMHLCARTWLQQLKRDTCNQRFDIRLSFSTRPRAANSKAIASISKTHDDVSRPKSFDPDKRGDDTVNSSSGTDSKQQHDDSLSPRRVHCHDGPGLHVSFRTFDRFDPTPGKYMSAHAPSAMLSCQLGCFHPYVRNFFSTWCS
jgi:hypothetical protein